jgi:hypothetical protein
LNTRSLSVEVKIFSFWPCMLVFSMFKCWSISVKQASFSSHFVSSRKLEKLWRKAEIPLSAQIALILFSLFRANWLLCVERVTWSFCIPSHSFANTHDLRGRCFIKLAMLTATTRTSFKSSPTVSETRTSRRRKQWVVTTRAFSPPSVTTLC